MLPHQEASVFLASMILVNAASIMQRSNRDWATPSCATTRFSIHLPENNGSSKKWCQDFVRGLAENTYSQRGDGVASPFRIQPRRVQVTEASRFKKKPRECSLTSNNQRNGAANKASVITSFILFQ
jgi:hypothetical protein